MYRGYAPTPYKLRRAVGSANFVEMGFNPFALSFLIVSNYYCLFKIYGSNLFQPSFKLDK